MRDKQDAIDEQKRLADIEQAKSDERDKIKAEQDEEDSKNAKAKQKREADMEHRRKYDEAASAGIQGLGVPKEKSDEIVQAISQNMIANLNITY